MRTKKVKSLRYDVNESPNLKEKIESSKIVVSVFDDLGHESNTIITDSFVPTEKASDYKLDLLLKSGINPSKITPRTSVNSGYESEVLAASAISKIDGTLPSLENND